jgi:hypothetical protein
MAQPFIKPWFDRLRPDEAARVVAALETIRMGGWLGIKRGPVGQYELRFQRMVIPMGQPGDTMLTAVAKFNNRLSRLVAGRFRTDRPFVGWVLALAVEAFATGDYQLCRGLLRRLLSLSAHYEVAGLSASAHPKSVVRMLGPRGNPSAAALSSVIRALADRHDVQIEIRPSPYPRSYRPAAQLGPDGRTRQ